MIVVVDMILAVAEVTFATGTIPELQLRVGEVGPAADSTFVSVRRFGGDNGSLIRSGIGEGDGLCFLFFGTALFEQPPDIHAPGHGDHIEDIFSKEQEVVGQGDNGEQIVGEGITQQADDDKR